MIKLSMWTKRTIMYLVIAAHILFFMWLILDTSNQITLKEIDLKGKKDNYTIQDLFENNYYIATNEFDFQYYGQYIWKISLYILQIIFLIILMLKIYVDEVFENSRA